jgi:hypothetical protein
MDMLHAKTLLLNKQYRACDERLAKMNIIPFEGDTEGRALYWEAKMMQAIEALGRKRPKEALKFMEAAGLWPENLGVGKPYDADIDIRLEQFLTAECLEALGRRNEAEALRSHITDFKPEIQNTIANFQPVNHLVVRWVRERTGSVSEWDVWMKKQEGSPGRNMWGPLHLVILKRGETSSIKIKRLNVFAAMLMTIWVAMPVLL